MTNNSPIIILGAGLTGLSLAHRLRQANKPYIVCDVRPHSGGVIQTHQQDGFVYESGPNSGILANTETVQLFRDLQNDMALEKANTISKARWVLKKGRWHALPTGLISGLNTPLFSWHDKLRLLGEPFRKKGKEPDETLASMVVRRMGKSFLDYAVDPFILGIYAGDPGQLVLRYALPKLYQLEQDYGSFIKGAYHKGKAKKTALEQAADRSIFSAQGGLSQLIGALENSVGQQNITLGISNTKLEYNADNKRFTFKYNKSDKAYSIESSTVVSTFGGLSLQPLLQFANNKHVDNICQMPYAGVIGASVGFKQWKGIPLKAFGGLIPHKEQQSILGALFMSSIFNNRAPADGALFSLFMGGVRQAAITDLDDEVIIKKLEKSFVELMGIKRFDPELLKIWRIQEAIPQYTLQSQARLASIAALEKTYPGLHLAGNIRDGIGMADRIKQAYNLADKLIQ